MTESATPSPSRAEAEDDPEATYNVWLVTHIDARVRPRLIVSSQSESAWQDRFFGDEMVLLRLGSFELPGGALPTRSAVEAEAWRRFGDAAGWCGRPASCESTDIHPHDALLGRVVMAMSAGVSPEDVARQIGANPADVREAMEMFARPR